MRRRIIAFPLIIVALCLLVITPVLAFTPLGGTILHTGSVAHSTPTAIPSTPPPIPTPFPVLTPIKNPPHIDAGAVYLLDADTDNVLDEQNGEKPMLMASTTKIMTALIAIQTANLNRPIPIHQDAIDRVILDDGSSAGLMVGDVVPLKDLLYALMLPSGNDAAYAIADELGGTRENFVARMNLFTYHLHLFQTHFNSPDGLTAKEQTHYTTAHDLAQLSHYALQIPLFAHIVETQTYTEHIGERTLIWNNTNTLLSTYKGATGIKTGHTFAAGYCLVFAATHAGHHLIGVILNSSSSTQRDADAATLLNWGFSLPLLPPQP
ncbi:D-alanyl-D-alanine carboxypeptidase family protein [Dictyobacter arantiisoli]|uniref:D-alanyl-D-alanine carboxypeptidase n=1 Tax=Dictyobacter arantiisoli TaxID=2014874 RepID=A0A5A5TAE8_9CHLR|nr:D-alanyl-D-alanine carboxypeptidase family protein [Dictyobacter arantiisoli]GCF07874.1 D-alanyl-D-alanine carboxypeptidase [Dictyobacter arantiisoli]